MKLYRPRRPADIESTVPLINIVFLLLIFFMISGELARPDPFPVEPPVSASRDGEVDAGLVRLHVSADRKLALDGNILDDRMLDAHLESLGVPSTVHLIGDGQVEARFVAELLGRLRARGVSDIRLATAEGAR